MSSLKKVTLRWSLDSFSLPELSPGNDENIKKKKGKSCHMTFYLQLKEKKHIFNNGHSPNRGTSGVPLIFRDTFNMKPNTFSVKQEDKLSGST